MTTPTLRHLQINGGTVKSGPPIRLCLPTTEQGYTDAQMDDYGGRSRRHYPWQPGVELSLEARFSHGLNDLIGTAGFGFWNAPFGDPSVPWPTLPQAVWFFFASPPNDLPLAPTGPGRGWFASTLDATTSQALVLAPFAPVVLLLNQITAVRHRLWPWVQNRLGISFAIIEQNMEDWHKYRLLWQAEGSTFFVDENPLLQTPYSPHGPLGFVCWIDNQYMEVTANGRFRWGTLPIKTSQWLEVQNLAINRT